MKFGAYMFPTDYSMTPQELGRALEERGFESLLFPEHTHIPIERRTPWPGGDELPKMYYDTLDPFVAMTAAALATERLKVGTGVCLVVQRDPIITAKEVSSIDQLSGGRVIFGVGAGWNLEEMAHHGTDPARRWKLMRERVEAIKRIWSTSKPEYQGEFVRFEPIYQWPKPVQKPHPPVLVGGNGPGVLKRVVRYGDGWMPNAGRPGLDLPARIAELGRLAEAAGREPIPVSVFGAQPTAEAVERLAELRVERALFSLPPAKADEVLPLLDEQAKLVERYS